MKTQFLNFRLLSVLMALLLGLTSCSSLRLLPAGQMKTETQSVDAGSASSANVQIKMDAGKLDIKGGADSLMQGTFKYNVESWQPAVNYNVNGDRGELVVNQPNTDISIGPNQVNEWNLQLNNEMPLEVQIHTGAGESILDLSSLDLTGAKIETGVGSTDIDLGGTWDRDINTTITGGVGGIKVHLPGDMGVQVNVESGLTGVTANGFMQDGQTYVNQAYGNTPHTLFVNIQAGVGGIELLSP